MRHGLRWRGFTLVELVVTVAIVAVLATGVLPLAEATLTRTREQDLRAALRDLRTAIDAYKKAGDAGHFSRQVGASGYPPSLRALVEGVPDARDPEGKRRIYFLRRIPRDPMEGDAALAADETWGLRSYASGPDAPAPGEDVFDIHSRSPERGMNGVPYREW